MTTAKVCTGAPRLIEKMFFHNGEISGHYLKVEEGSAEYKIILRVSTPLGETYQFERTVNGMHTAAGFAQALPNLVFEHDLTGTIALLQAMLFKKVEEECRAGLNDGSIIFSIRDVVYDQQERAEIHCRLIPYGCDGVASSLYIHRWNRPEAEKFVESLRYILDDEEMPLACAEAIIERIDNDAVTPINDRTWI